MKKQIMLGMFGFIVIIFLFLASTSFYTVKTGEVAIVSSWGKVSRIDKEGLNFKIPIVQTKEIMEIRDKRYNFDDMSVSTKDMQSIILDLTVQSFVSDPEKLYRAFKGMHETNFIAPRTKEVVQASI
ncbi:MAG: SPFH domain-containing protein, partial [Fusobacterium sp.]